MLHSISNINDYILTDKGISIKNSKIKIILFLLIQLHYFNKLIL